MWRRELLSFTMEIRNLHLSPPLYVHFFFQVYDRKMGIFIHVPRLISIYLASRNQKPAKVLFFAIISSSISFSFPFTIEP